MTNRMDDIRRKNKTYKNIIERDVQLPQGAGFG